MYWLYDHVSWVQYLIYANDISWLIWQYNMTIITYWMTIVLCLFNFLELFIPLSYNVVSSVNNVYKECMPPLAKWWATVQWKFPKVCSLYSMWNLNKHGMVNQPIAYLSTQSPIVNPVVCLNTKLKNLVYLFKLR